MSIVKNEPRTSLLTPELEREWRGAGIVPEGTTRDELEAFAATCARLGLDPLAKQIYLVRRYDQNARRERSTAQASIEGFRVVAERTGQYRGQTDTEWCGPDGKWRDAWLEKGPPAAARIGVYRDGFMTPLKRVARFQSYVQTNREGRPTRSWATMPDVMIAKCAEALALRAAFPNELGRIYTADEMAQADNSSPVVVVQAAQEAAQAPAPAPRALPAEAEGVPPDRPRQEAPGDWDAVREMFVGKLKATTTLDDMRAWMGELSRYRLPHSFRAVLWGMLCQHAQKLGVTPAQLKGEK